MPEIYVILHIFLLLGTNVFWAITCFRLTDRLMSRNYQEFVQGERLKKPTNVSARPKVALVDPIAEDNASKANKLFT